MVPFTHVEPYSKYASISIKISLFFTIHLFQTTARQTTTQSTHLHCTTFFFWEHRTHYNQDSGRQPEQTQGTTRFQTNPPQLNNFKTASPLLKEVLTTNAQQSGGDIMATTHVSPLFYHYTDAVCVRYDEEDCPIWKGRVLRGTLESEDRKLVWVSSDRLDQKEARNLANCAMMGNLGRSA